MNRMMEQILFSYEYDKNHRLNSFLPKDIAAKSLLEVGEEAHARFDATARTYEYFVVQQKNPFQEGVAYLIHKPINIEAMNQAAKRLFDFKDFTSFSKSAISA